MSHCMRTFKILFCFCFLWVAASCSQEQPNTFALIADDGTNYKIISKQKLLFNNDKMLVITYISADPSSENIRNKEFQDLYQITADNVNPNSDYDYVALVALEKEIKDFGITTNSGYRDRRVFSEVLALRKNDS